MVFTVSLILVDLFFIFLNGGILAFHLFLRYLPLGEDEETSFRALGRSRRDLLLVGSFLLTSLLKLMMDSQTAVGVKNSPLAPWVDILLLFTLGVLTYCLLSLRREKRQERRHQQEVREATRKLEEQLEEYIRKAVAPTSGTSPVREHQ